ncbi:hypothetical protein CDAR_614771 [Caerostris darwini]|uniref:Uncharacterized protein n=1 Tax=Caerostris darwini TaxID=1538125 RepID=A0AAV4U4R3_9ARAC|nr:hypothetical protein CDAR_614771 [Caerostris darwini]
MYSAFLYAAILLLFLSTLMSSLNRFSEERCLKGGSTKAIEVKGVEKQNEGYAGGCGGVVVVTMLHNAANKGARDSTKSLSLFRPKKEAAAIHVKDRGEFTKASLGGRMARLVCRPME